MLVICMTCIPSTRALSVPYQDGLSQEDVLGSVREVMSEDNFRTVRDRSSSRDERGFLERTLENLVDDDDEQATRRVSSEGNGTSGSAVGTAVSQLMLAIIIIVIFIVLGIIAWIIAKTVDFSSRRKSSAPSLGPLDEELVVTTPPGEVAVNEYERQALDMAGKGDFAGAIRQLLLGSMSWIERRGLIRFRAGLTNRDYLRAVWRMEQQRGAFHNNASEFERIFFGRRDATPAMFTRCLEHFRGAFRDENTAISPTV